MLYNFKILHYFINGNINLDTISPVDVTNPNVKVIALDSRVETEVELMQAA